MFFSSPSHPYHHLQVYLAAKICLFYILWCKMDPSCPLGAQSLKY